MKWIVTCTQNRYGACEMVITETACNHKSPLDFYFNFAHFITELLPADVSAIELFGLEQQI